jgi:MarR family transcriptional regulator, organic hydroperoxide resistance regulator
MSAGDAGAGVAQEVWGEVLDLAMNQRHRFFRTLNDFGFTFGDFRALAVMDPAQPVPMGSLAHAWNCDASNATWVVDRLEERGLVERRMLPTDRRVKTVVLTELGVKTKAELFDALYSPPQEFLALGPDRIEALRSALALLPESLRGSHARSLASVKAGPADPACADPAATLRPS